MVHGATHAFVAMLSFISKAGGFQSVVRCNPFLKLTFSHLQYSKKKKKKACYSEHAIAVGSFCPLI